MKIINTEIQDTEKQFIEANQKKELTKLASIKRKKGLFLFMYHKGKVKKVKLESSVVELGKVNTKRNKVTTIPGAKYVQALNRKNAIKKFLKSGLFIEI